MLRYTKEDEYYLLIHEGSNKTSVIKQYTMMGLCFHRSDGTLLFHSDPVSAIRYNRSARNSYLRGGMPDLADDLILYITNHIDVDELNKIITNDGYVKEFYEKWLLTVNAESENHGLPT